MTLYLSKVRPMNLISWLDADRGRLTALAWHFGLTQSAVSQWRSNGVPYQRMKAVRDYTAGAVTLEEMLPDPAWPHPDGRPCLDVAGPAEVCDAAA